MKRDAVIQIRLTPAEKAAIQGKAKAAGMAVAVWMRWQLLRRTK